MTEAGACLERELWRLLAPSLIENARDRWNEPGKALTAQGIQQRWHPGCNLGRGSASGQHDTAGRLMDTPRSAPLRRRSDARGEEQSRRRARSGLRRSCLATSGARQGGGGGGHPADGDSMPSMGPTCADPVVLGPPELNLIDGRLRARRRRWSAGPGGRDTSSGVPPTLTRGAYAGADQGREVSAQ